MQAHAPYPYIAELAGMIKLSESTNSEQGGLAEIQVISKTIRRGALFLMDHMWLEEIKFWVSKYVPELQIKLEL
jgi:hypothetical protein